MAASRRSARCSTTQAAPGASNANGTAETRTDVPPCTVGHPIGCSEKRESLCGLGQVSSTQHVRKGSSSSSQSCPLLVRLDLDHCPARPIEFSLGHRPGRTLAELIPSEIGSRADVS